MGIFNNFLPTLTISKLNSCCLMTEHNLSLLELLRIYDVTAKYEEIVQKMFLYLAPLHRRTKIEQWKNYYLCYRALSLEDAAT